MSMRCSSRVRNVARWAAALLLAAGSAASAQCQADWVLASPGVPTIPTDPAVRQNHAAAYDAQNRKVVAFGGFLAGLGFYGDTWTWDGEGWTQASTTGPAARGNLAMAYDSARNRVVLFGGAGAASQTFGDTWEWDGAAWTQLSPAASPPARFNHAMAYDSARSVVVMTGGFSTVRWGDTWEFDGTTWTERTGITGYGPRSSHGMAYDESRGRMVIFGGFGGSPLTRLADTWELTATGWVASPATGPIGRQYLGMDYDADEQVVVLFGGQIGPASGDREQDTWAYDGSAWTQIGKSGPPRRDQHTLTYDRANRALVVFGGYQGAGLGGTVGDTWVSVCEGCYANCDGSTSAPILNVNDFVCFQQRFAAGDAWANCDGSTSAPVLNVNDFVCFQQLFAAGCP